LTAEESGEGVSLKMNPNWLDHVSANKLLPEYGLVDWQLCRYTGQDRKLAVRGRLAAESQHLIGYWVLDDVSYIRGSRGTMTAHLRAVPAADVIPLLQPNVCAAADLDGIALCSEDPTELILAGSARYYPRMPPEEALNLPPAADPWATEPAEGRDPRECWQNFLSPWADRLDGCTLEWWELSGYSSERDWLTLKASMCGTPLALVFLFGVGKIDCLTSVHGARVRDFNLMDRETLTTAPQSDWFRVSIDSDEGRFYLTSVQHHIVGWDALDEDDESRALAFDDPQPGPLWYGGPAFRQL